MSSMNSFVHMNDKTSKQHCIINIQQKAHLNRVTESENYCLILNYNQDTASKL